MGTSKSFSDTRHAMMPNWGDLSSSITSSCDSSSLSVEKKNRILKNYVAVIGGSKKGGRGGSKIGGRSGIKTAKKIGGFFGSFTSAGNNIREALEGTGLDNLQDKSVSDVINHLIEYCSGSASTIDEIAAKEATRKLLEELISDANDIDDIGVILTDKFEIETSQDIIIKYFGYYIYEHLDKWFYEKLIKDKNQLDCNNLFRQIKDFIFESLRDVQRTYSLQKLDWGSDEADRLIKNMQEDILTVFE
ncbi:hypothetical protein [Aquimarina algicola]|uniref:Uncharacterized protein n=1 Tax=Aquimarina algicola TaxID=2589995 RepID=A0A504JCD3_9FLAO|nr:hypothetical protein [Aquimarina algicola]TPN86085.1 hypothetical protein FHK87_12490 [Aquimarina algicola]